MFINGCSFLTTRPRDNVHTHAGEQLAKMMDLEVEVNLANGGRGSKRLMWTTRTWCEKFPEQAEKCFFLIGSSGGNRFDYPTNDGYKKHKFPTMETTWKTWDPNRDSHTTSFIKYLFGLGADLDQMTQVESILGLLDLQDYFQNKKLFLGIPMIWKKSLKKLIFSTIKLFLQKAGILIKRSTLNLRTKLFVIKASKWKRRKNIILR